MVRPFQPNDIAQVAKWWEARKFPVLPPELLPKTGFIVEGLAAGFLYMTDSGIAWMEWLTSNPAADKIERQAALDTVIAALLTAANQRGVTVVFTSVENPGLIQRYGKHGFAVTENGMTNMLCKVGS